MIDTGTLLGILGTGLAFMTALVGVATAYLRLFVRNAVGDAKSEIIAKIEGYVTKEDLDERLRLELNPLRAQIAAWRRRMAGGEGK